MDMVIGVGLMIGLGDLNGLFQRLWFYERKVKA